MHPLFSRLASRTTLCSVPLRRFCLYLGTCGYGFFWAPRYVPEICVRHKAGIPFTQAIEISTARNPTSEATTKTSKITQGSSNALRFDRFVKESFKESKAWMGELFFLFCQHFSIGRLLQSTTPPKFELIGISFQLALVLHQLPNFFETSRRSEESRYMWVGMR